MPALIFFISALLLPLSGNAGVVSIVIDDIGYNYEQSLLATRLPPDVTLSVLPDSPYAREMAERAKNRGHELMAHIPMQSVSKGQAHEPNILHMDLDEWELRTMLESQLDSLPEAVGINNHQGSLLTRHPGHMRWVMQILLERGNLYFLDSRTHHKTVAGDMALQMGVPQARRDVFLDPQGNDAASINKQMNKVLATVEREGFALAIGHPFPLTVKAIKRLRQVLLSRGHMLVSTSEYIQLQEATLWLQQSSR